MRKLRIVLSVTLLSVAFSAGSCVMLAQSGTMAPLFALTGHENTVVSAPSWVGAALGALAGVPLAIVAAPVTIPIAAAEGGLMSLLPFTPILLTAEIGAVAIGGPAWLVAGWW